MRPLAATLAAALVPLLVASCSSSSTPGASQPAPPSPSTTTSVCPGASPGTLIWPAAVPQDFPKPPGATLAAVKHLPGRSAGAEPGVVVSLTVPASLNNGIRYINRALPAAGFTPGRGDAEPEEADIPFTRADVTGQLRLHRATTCQTTWILTVLPR